MELNRLDIFSKCIRQMGVFPNQFLCIFSVQILSMLISEFREIVRKLGNENFKQ